MNNITSALIGIYVRKVTVNATKKNIMSLCAVIMTAWGVSSCGTILDDAPNYTKFNNESGDNNDHDRHGDVTRDGLDRPSKTLPNGGTKTMSAPDSDKQEGNSLDKYFTVPQKTKTLPSPDGSFPYRGDSERPYGDSNNACATRSWCKQFEGKDNGIHQSPDDSKTYH